MPSSFFYKMWSNPEHRYLYYLIDRVCNITCLSCLRALCAYVSTCFTCLHALEPMCLRALRTYVPSCLHTLNFCAYVPSVFMCLRALILKITCLCAQRFYVPKCLNILNQYLVIDFNLILMLLGALNNRHSNSYRRLKI